MVSNQHAFRQLNLLALHLQDHPKLWETPNAVFSKDYDAITEGGAAYLVERGIELIGVDGLSVAPYDALTSPHETLLRANVVIVEGLNFSNVSPGIYTFVCLPLKIKGSDGAPARAMLIRDSSLGSSLR